MDTSGESWGWLPPPLPLPLTDGGAKTKQPSRQSGFRPNQGKHPLHQKSNVVREIFSRAPQERQRVETMLVVDDESLSWLVASMVGNQLKRTVIKEQSCTAQWVRFPHCPAGRELMQGSLRKESSAHDEG